MKEATLVTTVNIRNGCICRNGGKPDDEGNRYIDPCCRFHYAEMRIPRAAESQQVPAGDWTISEKRRRIHYPKMTVLKG